MGLWATQSRGKALWMKAKAVTITKRLENARVLRPPSAHVERSNHGSYLQKLRLGVKMIAGDSVVANFLNDARANVKAEEAQKALAAGLVQAERYDGDKELAEWQQGDRSMYTSENLKRRMALRRHPLVTASLQLFWEAALRSVQSGGDTTYSQAKQQQRALTRLLSSIIMRAIQRRRQALLPSTHKGHS